MVFDALDLGIEAFWQCIRATIAQANKIPTWYRFIILATMIIGFMRERIAQKYQSLKYFLGPR